ncbi:MAG: bacteriohemerythrin [Xanthomonadales bacterium]|nr:bacteriohemerythrin [Xanthomonadales bacterium]
MSLLQWKPQYALGIPSVDHEHREMIGMINSIYDQVEHGANAEAIERGLGEIHAGIAAHFALEERHMREAGYEEYAAHKEQHEELLDEIRDLMDVLVEDPELGRQQLQKRLSDWFSVHFATFDARLHHQLGDRHPH